MLHKTLLTLTVSFYRLVCIMRTTRRGYRVEFGNVGYWYAQDTQFDCRGYCKVRPYWTNGMYFPCRVCFGGELHIIYITVSFTMKGVLNISQ